MSSRENLHEQAALVFPGRRSAARMLLHALIDLGVVTKVECAYDDCLLPTRKIGAYVEGDRKRHRDSASIDHVKPLALGGTDRPDNLRLTHLACNVSFSVKQGRNDPSTLAKHSENRKRLWQDPDYRAKMVGRAVSEEERAKRSESMKRHWADPERRKNHAAGLLRGDEWRSTHNMEMLTCDECDKQCRGKGGLTLHKRKAHNSARDL